MEKRYLAHLPTLTLAQKIILAKGDIQTVSDILLQAPFELAKKCKTTLKDMEGLVDLVCQALNHEREPPLALSEIAHVGEEKFTSGDVNIDGILCGGIQTGMLWEISGENNAGKTQLALQLSLSVQLPRDRGGTSGVACYISTRGNLQTERLQQMIDNHPILSPEFCGFSDVYTLKALNFAALIRVVTEVIPSFVEQRAKSPRCKPPKVVVIDTFSDLFDQSKDPAYENFKTRARDLKTASLLLHQLATTHQVAVVVLCSTRAGYTRNDSEDPILAPGELLYSEHQRWFSRAHSVPGEDAHEGVLGHLWSNQVNARIMLTRTARTRPRHTVDPKMRDTDALCVEPANKRRRIYSGKTLSPTGCPSGRRDEEVPLRRLSVIFSSAGLPASCDYVVLEEGVIGFQPGEALPSTFLWETPKFTLHSILPPSLQAEASRSNPTAALSSTSGESRRSQRASSLQPVQSPPGAQLDVDVARHTSVPDVITTDLVKAGPPAEDDAGSDSDYYWQDDGDAPYTEL